MRLTDGITTLRRFRGDDLAAFQAYRNDPVIARFQSWEAMDDAEAARFLHEVGTSQPLLRPGHWAQIAVAHSDDNRLLGDIGLRLAADQSEAEIGITLARAAQGQGHGLRATQLAQRLILDRTDVPVIRVWADARNAASRKLAERAGFAFTGIEENEGVEEAAFELRR